MLFFLLQKIEIQLKKIDEWYSKFNFVGLYITINYITFRSIASYFDKYDFTRIHEMSYSVFDKDKIWSTSQNFPYPIPMQWFS